ncbi:MAG: glycosyltransferase family 4 protein [Candidatus Izemoplasmataceae bacterium]
MKIWIINQYNMPPEYGHLNRHYNFGKYLKRLGHEPTVFVGSYLHNTGMQMIKDKSLIKNYPRADFDYYFIKTCDYSSSRVKRVYAMYQFYRNVLKATKSLERPDVIIGSSAHPLAALAALKLAKKYKCQSIVEVRDLWPESFVAYKIISRKNPLLKFLYKGEKWIYKKADKLIFTMEGGKDYLVDKKWDKTQGGPIDINNVFHLNNGIDLEVFSRNKAIYPFEDEDLDDDGSFKVIYIGSIRLVNKIHILVDVAKELKDKNIKLLVWGDGDQLDILRSKVEEEGLGNLIFKGYVEKKYVPSIVSKSDLNIVMGESSSLFKYGTSMNKLFDYFASEKPTLVTFKSSYSLLDKYQSGLEITGDYVEIAETIGQIKNLSDADYSVYCKNALRAAKDYNYINLSKKLVDIINNKETEGGYYER